MCTKVKFFTELSPVLIKPSVKQFLKKFSKTNVLVYANEADDRKRVAAGDCINNNNKILIALFT